MKVSFPLLGSSWEGLTGGGEDLVCGVGTGLGGGLGAGIGIGAGNRAGIGLGEGLRAGIGLRGGLVRG